MTGGQVLLNLRNSSNQIFALLTTPVALKPGTFKRIERAINLQKEIVINDLYTTDLTYKYTSGSIKSSISTYDGKKRICFDCYAVSTSTGLGLHVYVYLTEDDYGFYSIAS